MKKYQCKHDISKNPQRM